MCIINSQHKFTTMQFNTGNNLSLDYAKNLARRWREDEISCTKHYYNKARQCLNAFRDYLSQEDHSTLVGLVEFYNHHELSKYTTVKSKK